MLNITRQLMDQTNRIMDARMETRNTILKRLKNKIMEDKSGFMSAAACCEFIENLSLLDLIEKDI